MSRNASRSLVERLENRVFLSSVLYRVNAGGPAVGGTPGWTADTSTAPSPYYVPSGSNVYRNSSTVDLSDPSVPAGTPMALFQTERYDTGGTPLTWDFPVAAGAYQVRLFFAESYSGNFGPGKRLFDVSIEGQLVLDDFDIYAQAGGGHRGIVRTFTINTADGTIDIDFGKVTQNPNIKAIEISTVDGAPTNQAPVVDAGTDQSITLPANATLNGTANDDALPAGSTLVTAWSQFSGPGTVTFASPNSPDTTASFSHAGTYVLRLSASDGTLSSSDDVTVTVHPGAPTNQAPTASAGSDQTITLPAGAALAGTASDDGLPNGSALTTTWRTFSGPGTVTFDNDGALSTTARFSVAGTYILRLIASDGELSTTDDITVTVNPAAPSNQAPVVSAGSDQTVTLPDAATLSGSVSDDGLPSGSTLTRVWSQVSGPGTVTFADGSAASTTATFSAAGTYLLRLTASDGTLSSSDELTVTVNPAAPSNRAPVVSAGSDATVTLPSSASLDGTASDDALPAGGSLSTTWSVVSGPGTVTFADAGAVDTTASFSVDGTYVLRLMASDGALSSDDDVTITVNPDAAQNQAPLVSAGADGTITLPSSASLDGSASDDGLPAGSTLSSLWSVVSGPGAVDFASATSPATTAAFSAAGTYVLRLTSSDGELSNSDDVTVTVAAEPPQNQAPLVSAGADQTLSDSASASLAGVASDDGLPSGSTLTTTWTKVSGPGTVTFAKPSVAATTVAFSAVGTYVLRLTASDGSLSSSDDVSITIESLPVGDVLYRVNAGGPAVTGTPDWAGDTRAAPSPFSNAAVSGSTTYARTSNTINMSDPSIPAGTPMSVFQTERYDGGGAPMQWNFAVDPGRYEVRLYFAEIYSGTFGIGKRVFDVSLEGQIILDNFDVYAETGGGYRGIVKTFALANTDGNIDLDFAEIANNPAIKAIEIIKAQAGPAELGALVSTINFGNVGAGRTLTRTITLSHRGATGDPDIVIDATTITGPSAARFTDSFNDDGNVTLAPGQSTTVDVTFAPEAEGTHDASLEIAHNGTNNPLTITLSGTGVPATAENQAPTVNAGTDQSIALPSAATLSGAAGDDGLPSGILTTTWTKVSGPGTVTFGNANSLGSTAAFSTAGAYVLRLTASDGALTSTDDVAINVNAASGGVAFGKSNVGGTNSAKPTSLQFGPDGRLYVAQQNGVIQVYAVKRGGVNNYAVTATETITLINTIPNHNDDGSLNTSLQTRLVTGLLVAGTAANPVIYVGSSDPRIGGGGNGTDLNLDTNSGIISRLRWNGTNWVKLDLVRGLPRSEENHASNGMQLDPVTNTLYVAQGGHTNMGATSNNFARLPEYALSAAILSIDLDAIGDTTYDLPTLDDETRDVDGLGGDGNEPFGGNNGKNQARLVTGGPVQVYSPGYRNAYDLVITRNGRMFTVDNGSNGGWGGVPLDSAGKPTTRATAGDATNAINEPGATHKDQLHYVTGPGYYGGHPNPTRANRNNTFNASNPQSPVDVANPVEGAYLTPDVSDGALVVFPASTNGIAEYTASNFGGEMTGDLLTVGHDNKLYRVKLNADGTMALFNQVLFSTVGAVPLDVVTRGDGESFAGSIWVADYWTGNIVVFEPNEVVGTGADDPALDEDEDGFDNADEIDNGTNPLSPGDFPADWDRDFNSDLNDGDDDNDALSDETDPFALDPHNGRQTDLPVRYTWENDAVPSPGGILNLGFTGAMTNGTTNYRNQFDPSKMTAGGAAGVMTIDEVSDGDALGATNTQQHGLQFGINVTGASDPFQVHTRVLAPFSGLVPQAGQSMGVFFGTGDQDNYIKLVVTGDDGGGVALVREVGGVATVLGTATLSLSNADAIDLYFTIRPGDLTAQAMFALTAGGAAGPVTPLGEPIDIPAEWLAATNATAPAVGIISSSAGPAPAFAATWDFFEVTPVQPARLGVSVAKLDFGGVLPGATATRHVTFTNLGGAGDPDVEITGTTFAGTDAAVFSDNFGDDHTDHVHAIVLAPGQSTTIAVTFAPGSVGSRSAELQVTHSGSASPAVVPLAGGAVSGLLGEYYDTRDLTVLKTVRIDPTINFLNSDWPNAPTGTAVTADDSYSERWTGYVKIDSAGDWLFTTNSNDGVRLWVNGVQLVNNWTKHSATQNAGIINLQPGWYPIKLEHFQDAGDVVIQLSFAGPDVGQMIIPSTHLATGTEEIPSNANKLGASVTGPIDFGVVAPGETTTRTVTLTNLGVDGEPNIVIDATSIVGAHATAFTDNFNDAGNITLAPGESITLTITFSPSGDGTKLAALQVEHSGENAPLQFQLSAIVSEVWSTGPLMPAALGEVAAGVIGNVMYVIGQGTSSTYAYDLASQIWFTVASRPLVGHHHAAEVFDGKLYVIGGLGNGSSGKVQIYNPVTNTWSTGADMPFLAGSVSTALINGEIYAAGGIIGTTTTNLAAKYNPTTNQWTPIASMPLGRNHTASSTDGSKLYVFGGRSGSNSLSNGFNDIQIYDPATGTWAANTQPGSTLAPLPQARGGMGKAVFYNGELYVIGGETSSGSGATADKVYNRVDIYNVATNTWRLGSPMPTARHGIFPLLSGTSIYVAGGGIKAGSSTSNILEILNLA